MDDREEQIRKGQAINLAVSAAIQAGKSSDTGYILDMFAYYHDVIVTIQGTPIKDFHDLRQKVK